MSVSKVQFLVDESGNRRAVLLDVERYCELLEAQEELESIPAYDEAKSSGDEAIPFSQAVKEIEGLRECALSWSFQIRHLDVRGRRLPTA